MHHPLYASLDEMLSREALSNLEGGIVTAVRRTPFHSVDSLSGSRFDAIETNGGNGERYIVKRIALEWDWIMRATDDQRARAVVAWQSGLLDRLPPEVTSGVLACARDGKGWAILMRDFSEVMVPPGDDPISAADNERFLEAMAAFGAAFWQEPRAADPALGFVDRRLLYAALSPRTGRREAGGSNPVPNVLVEGWKLLSEAIDPGLAGALDKLVEDPQPLCDALLRYPQTVVHGDWKLGNLGLLPGNPPQVVLLDWAIVGPAAPAAELAWYLAVNSARLPVSKEVAGACYRDALLRRLGSCFDEAWWQPQLDLGLLGAFLMLGWSKALGAVQGSSPAVRARERAELTWWSEHAQTAMKWL